MKIRHLLLVLALVVVFAGCEKKPAAVVNGEKITEEMLALKLSDKTKEHESQSVKADPTAMRGVVLEQMISELIFLQGAHEAGITISKEDLDAEFNAVKERIGPEEFKKQLAERKLTEEEFKKILGDNIVKNRFADTLLKPSDITDAEIEKYYKESPRPFLTPAKVEIRFLQVPTYEQAAAIYEEIKGKKNVDKAFDSYKDKDGMFVSEYGWVTPHIFSEEIQKGIKSLEPGKAGGPYKAMKGYYLIALKSKQGEMPKSLDEAKEEIRNLIYNQKRSSTVVHWVANRRSAAKVKIN